MSSETARAVPGAADNSARLAPPSRWVLVSLIAFAALMAAAFAIPNARGSTSIDDDWTRNTVRVSLVFYALAEGFALARRLPGLVRLWWTLGWLGYVIHLWVAFQIYHHGSHAEAVEHVREAAGVGAGIFVSHFFTLVWTLDVAACWLAPAWRARWPGWAFGLIHGFMAFIVFCATVIYETGPIRWAGVAVFLSFAIVWQNARRRRAAFRDEPPSSGA
jgi:hypothetical protein